VWSTFLHLDVDGDFLAVEQHHAAGQSAGAAEERPAGRLGGRGGRGQVGRRRLTSTQLHVDRPVQTGRHGRRRRRGAVGAVFTDGRHVPAVLRPLLATTPPLGRILLHLQSPQTLPSVLIQLTYNYQF